MHQRPAGAALFPATHWSLILSAHEGEARRRQALEELAATYWRPLYVYVRRKGWDSHGAEDIIQGFLERLLGRDFLDGLDPEKGRFRSYLRTSLDRYMINLGEKERAQRRGGGRPVASLDVEGVEDEVAASPEDPARAYDRSWARGVLDRALTHLGAEHAGTPKQAALEVAMSFFRPGDPPSYADAAARAGMTLPQFRSFLHRTRLRYRELIGREVAPTVGGSGAVEAEVEDLLKILTP